MAEQKRKTQAEKAASTSKGKRTPAKSPASAKKEKTVHLPARIVCAVVCLILFILFLVVALQPSGVVPHAIESVMLGLIGRAGFYLAIPALLYLFAILAFSGKRRVIMRSVCTLVFVFLVGCFSHLTLPQQDFGKGLSAIQALYTGGSLGTSAGLLCGGFAMLAEWLCGKILCYIIFAVSAVFCLLAAAQITIPSIIRALQNRPRGEWEDEEVPEQPEPAAIVVNHIASKRIAHEEQKRRKMAQQKNADAPDVQEMLRQIENDVETPVAAAGKPAAQKEAPVQADSEPELMFEAAPQPVPEEGADAPAGLQKPSVQTPPVPTPPAAPAPQEKVTAKQARASAAEVAAEIAQAQTDPQAAYCYPPVSLLRTPSGSASDGTAEMRENSRRLSETLQSFKVEAHIINVTRGPSVTRYEVELEKGVRLNKLTTTADDIALSLGASGVRIAAVPGKISVVGIEVPNKAVTTVTLREVVDSPEFTRAKSTSSFAVGKDIAGNCIVGDIARLPHMLIAGTTGSGKSVCMNSIIISLLYKAGPEDVRLIMVDPKMVELGIYNGIPHLLIPVVTDPKKAAGSLQWAVTEMMRRYRAMSDAGVRDLESYNSIIASQEVEGEKLPQIVVIIDELADLMLVAAKEVEESICRIAQMGRAAGIHLVIATQRPSADVITGLMKANIPSRIAFAVASAMESRIILDTPGAEKLVGKGDMLYAPIGCGKPKRVQGCFVSDAEVEAVATYVKEHDTVTYDQQVMDEIEKKAAQTGGGKSTADADEGMNGIPGDEMLPAAVDVILETGQASVSMLQRRLKLGYARAARIVDEMEENGYVGPFQGSKPREIRITKEQWAAIRGGQSEQLAFADFAEEPEAPEAE